jgi:predicted dehydrogenase
MENQKNKVTRRDFLRLSAFGLTSLTILPSWTMQGGARIAPSDRVVLGFIGLGRQGIGDFHSFAACPGVQVVAGSDVDSIKNDRFKLRVNEWQKKNGMPERCDTYEFYEQLLERKDIDAIAIATPDHWHALNVIHSVQAGKDVYCQKPLAYNISESLAMVKAVRDNGRVLQVGSQQRSDKEFIQAVKLVRSGALGYVKEIHARVGDHPTPFNLPEEVVPSNLNFNKWLGPLNFPVVHYNSKMCPPIAPPDFKERGDWAVWRYYKETGNGFIGDWGAHMFDIAQQALGMDGLGPTEFIPKGYKGAEWDTQKYANGQVMYERPFRDDKPNDKGVRFVGDKASLQVGRGFIQCSDPSLLQEAISGGNDDSVAQISAGHMQDFINSVRSRKEPIAPVEAGASTTILFCNINIAHELQRPVIWDPVTSRFVDDKEAEAHRLYFYEYRKPYKLPYWA